MNKYFNLEKFKLMMRIKDIKAKELAILLGCTKATIHNKLANLSPFTFDEVVILSRKYNIKIEELINKER